MDLGMQSKLDPQSSIAKIKKNLNTTIRMIQKADPTFDEKYLMPLTTPKVIINYLQVQKETKMDALRDAMGKKIETLCKKYKLSHLNNTQLKLHMENMENYFILTKKVSDHEELIALQQKQAHINKQRSSYEEDAQIKKALFMPPSHEGSTPTSSFSSFSFWRSRTLSTYTFS